MGTDRYSHTYQLMLALFWFHARYNLYEKVYQRPFLPQELDRFDNKTRVRDDILMAIIYNNLDLSKMPSDLFKHYSTEY